MGAAWTFHVFAMAVLMMYSVIGMKAEMMYSVIGVKADKSCGDASVANLAAGGQELRNLVKKCSSASPFSMTASAVELLLRNIPVRFDQLNDHPRGCVEMDMEVEEIKSGTTQKSWRVTIDVDNQTNTQNSHYGYTVYGTKPKVPKATGHVFFPKNVFPPNVRPFLGESKGQVVHFTDQKNGPPANTVFKLTGIMYNQYRLSGPSPPPPPRMSLYTE